MQRSSENVCCLDIQRLLVKILKSSFNSRMKISVLTYFRDLNTFDWLIYRFAAKCRKKTSTTFHVRLPLEI